ncbi:hypothetical protein L915_13172 [Phytophthora nicotianae]|uniref:Uncharacterized protein n=1 Tax=Phytophthora nicotianae TaxID=4792 RepID=W2GE26_PHYNI|nr:hypothetical protein L915_13172 [Phytophthora nicotianae]
MSFWETTREDEVIVTDAIAFINSFEACLDEREHNGVSADPKRKKKRNPPGYTTSLQRRKRAELQNLLCSDYPRKAQWKALVEYERDARRQAEEANCRLKEILSHQLDTNKKLCRALQKQSLLQGFDFVFGTTPVSPYSFAAFENSKAITDHLQVVVDNLYLTSESLFEPLASSSTGYSVRTTFDKERGKVAEMKATTPVACSMEETAKSVWLEQNGHQPDPQKWARRMLGRKPNSQEKNWILSLTYQSYVKHVKGIQLLQKFEAVLRQARQRHSAPSEI